MKHKILTLVCAAMLAGSLSYAAEPAVVGTAPASVYTQADGSRLTLQLPDITISTNPAAAQKINAYFAKKAASTKAFFDKQQGNGSVMSEDKSYEVTLNDGTYLSFVETGHIRFEKEAHPTYWKTGVTFDLATGEVLNWQDLVKPEDAKAFTLKNINRALLLSKYHLSGYFTGLTELPKNFYLDKNRGIHFIFGLYEVAPYSTGIVDLDMMKNAK